MPESIPSFGPNEKLPEPYLLPENTIIAQDGLFKTNLSSGWVALPPKVVGPGGVARLLGISATGAAIFSPARPTAVTATPGVLEASVAFTAPVDSGGSSVIDYLVSTVPPGNYG